MALMPADAQLLAQKLQEGKPVVVKFTAQWCGPCKAYGPTVEAVAKSHPQIEFLEVDLDAHPDLARQWQVRSIPMTLGFKDGKPAFQVMGALPRTVLEQHLKALA